MAHIYAHPAGSSVRQSLQDAIEDGPIWIRPSRSILFVCGGAHQPLKKTLRSFFLRHASQQIRDCNILLAEHAFDDINSHTAFSFRNIAEFEHLLTQVVDCVLIFPESAGSLAELGFFANSDARKKTLVVNRLAYQSIDSFINAGIIDFIDEESDFRSQIHIDFDGRSTPDFSPVEERLKRLDFKRTNRKRLKSLAGDVLTKQVILYLVTYLVHVCKVLHIEDLRQLSEDLLNSSRNIPEFDELISFCLGAGLLRRRGDDKTYLAPCTEENPFVEIKTWKAHRATMACVQFYQQHAPEVYDLIGAKK